jgi:hypothetical protein
LGVAPLHLSQLDRDPAVIPWCRAWLPSTRAVHVLSREDWFTLGHGIHGNSTNSDGMWTPLLVPRNTLLIWHPAPAAAEAALEELCISRHKRPYIHHLFVCPPLYTHAWRKRLFKFADFVFNLSPGFIPGVWGPEQHEPLVFGIFLPPRPAPPWLWKGSPELLALHSRLRRAFATRDYNLHLILASL